MKENTVHIWEETVVIPTYEIGKPDKNPMFLEKRVYQGSSGVVYPHPVIDQVYDIKKDKSYQAVFLENEYLRIMILPELGGRVQMAYDKTNNYHFVYYNQVIKPALVGLAGPWISGGIEFNWPQHHRPSTFDPIDYHLEEHEDGSATVWVSEIEKMFHTKGMAGFRLYPGKAYLEITGKLYNRTDLPQTFLWWANPAVAVDDDYQSVFPPDVHAVYDHGKRDVSLFPIAKGTYYKKDYAPGTDISWYKNIPVPTSFMAVNSRFDFVGGYHHKKKAGLLHVANHHISPGKKQWTWGHGDFGKMWDQQLTDEDGPYVEIMTGVYTDNQPDFSWIMANQEISFTQYFLPYKNVGCVKNATKDILVNLETADNIANVRIYSSSAQENLQILLTCAKSTLLDTQTSLSPVKSYEGAFPFPPECEAEELELSVFGKNRELLISYRPEPVNTKKVSPDPAAPMLPPAEMKTMEQLYMAGLHLEQYRHASFSALDYYQEGIRRNPEDIRCNNAMGLWYYRRGRFEKATAYFQKAVDTLLHYNPNPYNAEPIYNLGLSLLFQRKFDQAYTFFYKATWNSNLQDTAYLQLARIESRKKNWSEALQLLERSLIRNSRGYVARHLKSVVLRKMNALDAAIRFSKETISLDPFDFGTLYELGECRKLKERQKSNPLQKDISRLIRNNEHSFIEIAIDYAIAGLYQDAIDFLALCEGNDAGPLLNYYRAYCHFQLEENEAADKQLQVASAKCPDGIFPNRLQDILVLQFAINRNPQDYQAAYYLGNLWYDKRQYTEAIECWEKTRAINSSFPTARRNLAIAYYNHSQQPERALEEMQAAFEANPADSRILMELDQLRKRLNSPVSRRLFFLKENATLLTERDDLYLEYITLENLMGHHEKALELLLKRKFHPWEGGEGKIAAQYRFAKLSLAKGVMNTADYTRAIDLLGEASDYPDNLGEGKLPTSSETDIDYYLGFCYREIGEEEKAREYFHKAVAQQLSPTAALYYNDTAPEHVLYQGWAWQALGLTKNAKASFEQLIEYGRKHLGEKPKKDYFAVSLPDLLIFDENPEKRNAIHCHYMIGLGYLGLQQKELAAEQFSKVLELDCNHIGVRQYANEIELPVDSL